MVLKIVLGSFKLYKLLIKLNELLRKDEIIQKNDVSAGSIENCSKLIRSSIKDDENYDKP